MEVQYHSDYSPALNRQMEWKSYGSAGRPLLFLPCQDGRFYDFENFGMAETFAPWIDRGELMVFTADSIDKETWSAQGGDPRARICLHEDWVRYLTDELVPAIRGEINWRNGWTGWPGVMIAGFSLGAFHAANLYFRRPDLFDGLLALSGLYTASYGFGSYMDDLVYLNSPEDYLQGMAPDHPYIGLYNKKRAVICTGQGPWECPDYTRRLEFILREKNINVWVDYWGYDVSHDWPWWKKQSAYFLPYLLERSSDQ